LAEKAKVAVFVSGSGTNMAALLYASRLPGSAYEIVLVTGDRPDAPGLALAEAEGVPVARFERPTAASKSAFFTAIEQAALDAGARYIALAGFMRILPSDFVARWEGRMVNIHPSLLPLYTGLHTHQRAIDAGDSHGGCTVHLVTADLDEGPMLGQVAVAIQPHDTAETLAARVLLAEHQLYSRCLSELVTREFSSGWLTQQVRDRALGLPDAEETTSHGMACFGIAKGKKFAWVTDNHHGDGRIALLVKISGLDEQEQLIETDPDRYFRAAYFGDGWIAIRLDLGYTDWDDIAEWLRRSWVAVAPKRLAAMMEF